LAQTCDPPGLHTVAAFISPLAMQVVLYVVDRAVALDYANFRKVQPVTLAREAIVQLARTRAALNASTPPETDGMFDTDFPGPDYRLGTAADGLVAASRDFQGR
jgi:hypothetical protein